MRRHAISSWTGYRAPRRSSRAPACRSTASVLDAAGDSLKVVANFGVGYDNIDLDAARRRKRARDQHAGRAQRGDRGARRDADARRRPPGRRRRRDRARRGNGTPTVADTFLGRNLVGATVGLVGFGRIGQTVAACCRGSTFASSTPTWPTCETDVRGPAAGSPRAARGGRTSSACTWHSPRAPGI